MDAPELELLTRLLDEHSAALVLYAQQWCRTPEDVVQEAFVALMHQKQPPGNAVGWLYRVVRNAAISVSRSEERRRHHESAAADPKEPWFNAREDERIDASIASAALQELPLEQRETVVARLWGGLSFEQIADLMQTSVSTAHRRYVAGLTALRERLSVPCRKPKTQET